MFITHKENFIKASHDGYKKDGIFHTRTWKFEDNKIIIEDNLNKKANAIARIHFHPNITKDEISAIGLEISIRSNSDDLTTDTLEDIIDPYTSSLITQEMIDTIDIIEDA